MPISESYSLFARKRPVLVILTFLVGLPYLSSFIFYDLEGGIGYVELAILIVQYLAMLHLGYVVFPKRIIFYLYSAPLMVFCIGIYFSSNHWLYGDELLATGAVGTVVGIILNQINYGSRK